MADLAEKDVFATLRRARRIWAIGAIHGEIEPLRAIHETILRQAQGGDRLIYLGNYLGRGAHVRAVVDEMLRARRKLLAMRGMFDCDIAFLRGAQEEMWQKMMQLQFATNPREVLQWAVNHGAGATIQAYGGNIEEGLKAVRDGAMTITRWTNGLRQTLRNAVGHNELLSKMRRAALTEDGALLFVSAGVDVQRPLGEQGDAFWWGAGDFLAINAPVSGASRVIRGFDRANQGPVETAFTLTLDGGCGRGGKLLAGLLLPDGRVEALYEA